MKRFITMVLAILMLFGTTACNVEVEDPNTPSTSASNPDTTTMPDDTTKTLDTTNIPDTTVGLAETIVPDTTNVPDTTQKYEGTAAPSPEIPTLSRSVGELSARYSANGENGYSIWYGSGSYFCADYHGYKTFSFDDDENYETQVHNATMITKKGQDYRIRSAVDGKILFTTENDSDVRIVIPEYKSEQFFKDGYVFAYSKKESYDGVTYKIGFMNHKGEWIVPLSANHPILEKIGDAATVSYFSKSIVYCGEGIVSFGIDDTYYLYSIEKNTVTEIMNEGKVSDYNVRTTLSPTGGGGLDFNNGFSVESYGYGTGYYKLSTDGTMEKIECNFHEDLHEREGALYYDAENNRFITMGYTYHKSGFALFDSKGAIIKRFENLNLSSFGGFRNGRAQIILTNKENSAYYTVMDIEGNFLFEPVAIKTNSVFDLSGNEIFITLYTSSGDNTVVDDQGNIVLETGFVYNFDINNGVAKYSEKYKGNSKYVEIKK